MIITERASLFEKHGLAVKTIDKRRAVGVVQGMMDGELQFGNLASPSMLRMVLQGEADIVFLALGINQQFLATRRRRREFCIANLSSKNLCSSFGLDRSFIIS